MSASDEIKQRIDIVDFISRYTPLKKAGTTYKGLCPFHSERTPSFVVFPHTGTWHCFGACGIGGDVFSFLMQKENIEFFEALQVLAQEAGVELEDSAAGSQRQRTTLYEINDLAARYYQEILRNHPAASQARAYLDRRGVDSATIEQFRLGFALDSWDSLRDYLAGQGHEVGQMLEAGLVKENEDRGSIYDAFRSRVMIPIADRQNRIIGFGGRVLGEGVPKYLNTAETPVFHKSHVVYGLNHAYEAIRSADRVVIVEGYMDVIAAHQHGCTNVVACMGTALTPEQLRQLQRFTRTFVLALDADAAGQQATIRGLNQARQALAKVRKPSLTQQGALRLEERLGAELFICSLPDGRDPDDIIRQSPGDWQEFVDGAKPLVDYYFQVVASQVDLTSARGKGAAVGELAPLIAELEDEIEREHYVQQLSRLVQIDERTINGRVQAAVRTSQLAAKPRPSNSSSRFGIGPRARPTDIPPDYPDEAPPDENPFSPEHEFVKEESPSGGRRLNPEEDLLAHLLHEPELLVWLAGASAAYDMAPPEANDWRHVENQEIFSALKRFITRDEQWDLELFQESLTTQLHGRLARLVAAGTQLPEYNGDEIRQGVLKLLVRLRIERLGTKCAQIKYLIDEAQRTGERDEARSYYAINNQTLRELSHLQSTFGQLSRVLVMQRRPEMGVKIG